VVPLPITNAVATAVISTFIFLQLLGVTYVTYYIYKLPTWSHAWDSFAMVRIGASMKPSEVGRMGSDSTADLTKLTKVEGVIGLKQEGNSEETLDLGAPLFDY
jgi:hypothetical protein